MDNTGNDSEVTSAGTEAAYAGTLRQILTDAVDITTPPRKTVLLALAEYPLLFITIIIFLF